MIPHPQRRTVNRTALLSLAAALAPLAAQAGDPPLLPRATASALANELSGASALRSVEALARHHRMRGSRGFHAAAEHVRAQLEAAGLADAHIEAFPADGRTFYGTQKSRRPWDADFAELWEVDSGGARLTRIVDGQSSPLGLAQDSASGEAAALLVDVGTGTAEADYAGREVRGKLVLAAAQPGPVARLAVAKHGAAGVISYAQNQRTAWWGEDAGLLRWGHLDTFAPPSFAFMVTPFQARAWQERLAAGQAVHLQARVVAGQHDGVYEVVTATLPGSDPALRAQEIAFSCHLDHPSPGANDNASGCATILEIARAVARLVKDGRIPPPKRTLRWIFPPEVEGTVVLLNARPEWAAGLKAAIHMDMVGGGEATKAVFHVTRGPASLPSFVNDVAEAFGQFVNAESDALAAGRATDFPLTAPGGDKRALQAEMAEFTMGSDHEVYTDSSFSIPAVYLNDWPDRYIHTQRDRPENIDATKLARAGFIGAATALVLADLTADGGEAVWRVSRAQGLRRLARLLGRRENLPADEAAVLTRFGLDYERRLAGSLERFFTPSPALRSAIDVHQAALTQIAGATAPARPAPGGEAVYQRTGPKGPMTVFGYDYFNDKFGEEKAGALTLLKHQGLRGGGGEYAYEALNLLDGHRTLSEVRDALSAIYGPVPLDVVAEYVKALESIGSARRVN
jgi:aminopeptidase YwaD